MFSTNQFIFRTVPAIMLLMMLFTSFSYVFAANTKTGNFNEVTSIDENTNTNETATIDKKADTDAAVNTDEPVVFTYADPANKETKIVPSVISDINTIVLPSTVSPESVTLYYETGRNMNISGARGKGVFNSGTGMNLNEYCYKDEYTITFTADGEGTPIYTLRLLFSKNIPAVYLLSKDPVKNGRAWVEFEYDKSNKAKGSVFIQKASGEIVYSGALAQIKGRGNTTWDFAKKPYQIKLEEKADLLETGDSANKSRTWILLANYLDPSGIKNTLALNLGIALGMPANIQGQSVDLYYDGEYRGTYMLTEKSEVGSGRVDIRDLEEENKKANENIDTEKLPSAYATTANGAEYKYCEGMASPEDISGGYLLEMDYRERALEEACYFRTKRNIYVVVKSPEFASKEEMDYIATLYQEYEDAVFEGGINSQTHKMYSDYIDVRSVACYYLVNEFSKARDCFQSSAYLHKKAGDDKFYMSPLWDYDMSFGKGNLYDYTQDDNPYGIVVPNSQMGMALLKINNFYYTAKNIYEYEFLPLIKDVVLGDINAVSKDGSVRSLAYYFDLISPSALCNTELWYADQSPEEEIGKLLEFVTVRSKAMTDYFNTYPNLLMIPEDTFFDVFKSDWYHDCITDSKKKGILTGMGNGMFCPNYKVLRSHAVQSVYNMAGRPAVEYIPYYTDVSADAWYKDAIVWTAKNGLVGGYQDLTFKPDNSITREEFIDILYRAEGSPIAVTDLMQKFPDASAVTKKDAVEWALANGILQGDGQNLNPAGTMTRAEFAAILIRYKK